MNGSDRHSIAYVTPRYGVEVVGGAESAARSFAEGMAARGHEVTVLTTTAIDSHTWANHFPAAETVINGVVVRRFHVDRGRDPNFLGLADLVLPVPRGATPEECDRFIDLQGPISSSLMDAIGAYDGDFVAFYPYLYHPTVEGIRRVRGLRLFHPAAHDEPQLALPIFDETFGRADGLVFQTDAESTLVHERFAVGAVPSVVLGLGINPPPERIQRLLLAKWGLENKPYVVCLGRVDGHKGALMLAELFYEYKRLFPSDLTLVYAGQVVVPPRDEPDILCVGTISENEKWALLEGSIGLIQPSYFEAFSIVLFEAWAVRKPVLVNAACGATNEHVVRSAGGMTFSSFGEFVAAMEVLRGCGPEVHKMGELGHAYMNRGFRWERVLDRYERFLDRLKRGRHKVLTSQRGIDD
ncbi:MAG: glycosyltransferase family 4 protein [Acidimicrobiales bacterium]